MGSLFIRHETVLLLVIALEMILFQQFGRNFFAASNTSNIFRHSVEIGLLALVMTPVILTGGIDLSVGSMMGLCAVTFGILAKQYELSPWLATTAAIALGALGGMGNAWLITKMNLPPLIVTLGTFSLFRGLAEALTKGAESYTNFSTEFLNLGNGNVLGLPTQLWIFLAVATGLWILVHRTTWGRSLRAIGFSAAGARYAGLPVKRHTGSVYVLAGAIAGLAAVISVSRLGEARASVGIGYELLAITAVVLGGTSIFGGAGSITGTILGYVAIAILNNGLSRITELHIFGSSVSSVSRELSGMLTGLLLLLALAAAVLLKSLASRRARRHSLAAKTTNSSHL